jgi:hypothetical protein
MKKYESKILSTLSRQILISYDDRDQQYDQKNIGEQIKELYKDCQISEYELSKSWWNTPKSVHKKFIQMFSKEDHMILQYKKVYNHTFNNIDDIQKPIIIDNVLFIFGVSCKLLGITNTLSSHVLSRYGIVRSHRCIIYNGIFEEYQIFDDPDVEKEYLFTSIESMGLLRFYFFKFTDIPIIPVKGIQVLQLLNEMNILFEPLCKIIALEYYGTEIDDYIDFIQKMNT